MDGLSELVKAAVKSAEKKSGGYSKYMLSGLIAGQSSEFTDTEKLAASVVYVSMILGFCGTRLLLGEPAQFDLEQAQKSGLLDAGTHSLTGRDELAATGFEFAQACRLIDKALASSEVLRPYLQSVKGSSVPIKNTLGPGENLAGGIIVGKPGGSSMPFRDRLMEIRSQGARTAREEYWKLEPDQSGTGYQGIGAYVGIVDDPVNNTRFAKVTQRAVVQRRWRPQGNPAKGVGWGQLGTGNPNKPNINLDESNEGMGGLKQGEEESLTDNGSFGYTHGMILAIGESIKRGPWCIPFEMAAGKSTKKLASCFMCTVYMYSAGFPPSSIHLDRAESWWPLIERGTDTDVRIAKSLNDKWKLDCKGMLLLGIDILSRHPTPNGLGLPKNKERAAYLGILDDWLRQMRNLIEKGEDDVAANMFLDSALYHANDKKKIMDVLGPIWAPPAYDPDKALKESNPKLFGKAKEWP